MFESLYIVDAMWRAVLWLAALMLSFHSLWSQVTMTRVAFAFRTAAFTTAAFALGLSTGPSQAFAAAAAKKKEQATETKSDDTHAIQASPMIAAASPSEVRTEKKRAAVESASVVPLSMRGGASLGNGMAAFAGLNATTSRNVNNGFVNVQLGMLFAASDNFDIGFNLRVPMFGFGLSPGASMRYTALRDNRFALGIVANLNVPMIFSSPGTWVGLSVEPGLMASYFVNDNVEFFSGVLFTYAPLFMNPYVPGSGHATFMGTFRAGLAYQVTNSNVGFFANIDLSAGYEPVRTLILIGSTGTGLAFNAGFTVGSQFKF
jgi:hypothetical protein